ncbi:hypothetical protein D3C75_809830 [compost metagenome]
MSRKNAATGTQTIPAPTAGNSDRNAINTAQSNTLGMSRNQKIRPPSAPCVIATSRLPLTVARTTRLNLSCKRRFCCSSNGTAVRTLRASSAPSRRKKNSRYSMMKKLTMNSNVPWPKMKALAASSCPPVIALLTIFSRSPFNSPMPKRSSRCWKYGGRMCLNCVTYPAMSSSPLSMFL